MPATFDSHPWIAAQRPALVEAIRAQGRMVQLRPDAMAYLEGDEDSGLWLVLDGLIRLDMATGADASVMLGVVGRAGVFGRSRSGGLGSDGQIARMVTARAIRPTTAFLLSDRAMERIGSTHPDIWRALNQALQMQLDAVLTGMMGLLLPPRQRIASRLLQAMRAGEVALTQGELAEFCGLSRKTVHGHLDALEAEGAITRGYGQITITNAALLSPSE